jgi:DNA-binding CsgD family transcriptional regulator
MAGDVQADGSELLTAREREVLELLRVGLTNEEIARRLGISLDGAKYHVSQIIGKLGVRDRHEAARWSARAGRPWWAVAGAPVGLLWRTAGTLLPVKLSAVAAGVSAVALVTVVSGLGLIAVLLVRGGEAQQAEQLVRVATPIPTRARWDAVVEPITTVETLDEAAALVPYALHVPSRLPDGFQFYSAQYHPGGSRITASGELVESPAPSDRDIASLHYRDSDTGVNLVLNQQAAEGIIYVLAGHAEAIRVDGVTGEIVRGESFGSLQPGYVTIQWKKDGMSFSAASTLNEQWTLDDLLEVLASIEQRAGSR